MITGTQLTNESDGAKMKNSSKAVVSFLLVAMLLMTMVTSAYAGSSVFRNAYVDSNSWSYITKTANSSGSSTGTILISNLYKADGSASNYTTVFAKATSGGTYIGVSKGRDCSLDIPAACRVKNAIVELYAMGNWPWLDCQMTGHWTVN